jgi:hypothetical protein
MKGLPDFVIILSYKETLQPALSAAFLMYKRKQLNVGVCFYLQFIYYNGAGDKINGCRKKAVPDRIKETSSLWNNCADKL